MAVRVAEYDGLLGLSSFSHGHPGSRPTNLLTKTIGGRDQNLANTDDRLTLFAEFFRRVLDLGTLAESSLSLIPAMVNNDGDTQLLADCVKLGIGPNGVPVVGFHIVVLMHIQELAKFFAKRCLLVRRHPFAGSCESDSKAIFLVLWHVPFSLFDLWTAFPSADRFGHHYGSGAG